MASKFDFVQPMYYNCTNPIYIKKKEKKKEKETGNSFFLFLEKEFHVGESHLANDFQPPSFE